MFLSYINYFRGFAILMIVLGHGLILLQNNIFLNKFFIAVIGNGTGLFVFISGFLFYHIFYRRGFNLKKFMINKLKNVFLPYSVISIPALIYLVYKHERYQEIYKQSKILYGILYYLSGQLLGSTWYIPFAMLLFLSSPIFIRYINLKPKIQIMIILISGILGMIIGRPIYDLTFNVFQAFTYFFPYYCMGIYTAINQEKIIKELESRVIFLGILWGIFICFQVKINMYFGVFKKLFEITDLDLMMIQKIIMCLFAIGVFKKLEDSNLKRVKNIFNLLGEYSFGIFFIHNYFYVIFYKILKALNIEALSLIESVLLGILNIVFSVISIYIIKKILKKKSRIFIGC